MPVQQHISGFFVAYQGCTIFYRFQTVHLGQPIKLIITPPDHLYRNFLYAEGVFRQRRSVFNFKSHTSQFRFKATINYHLTSTLNYRIISVVHFGCFLMLLFDDGMLLLTVWVESFTNSIANVRWVRLRLLCRRKYSSVKKQVLESYLSFNFQSKFNSAFCDGEN